MKKLLMLILIGLLLALSAFIVIRGFEVGKVEVLSYTGLQEKNRQLDESIQEASKLAQKDFREIVYTVDESSKKLEQTKKEYQDMIAISDTGDAQVAAQIERYEVETLWVKLGNYATSEGAVVRIDIVQGNTSNTYNLRFTVNGSYISITDFISDIENDSTLGFKIEEFKMVPTENNNSQSTQNYDLQATFVCKEIGIKEISATSNPNIGTTQVQNNTTNNTATNTNTTNTANTSTSTTNTNNRTNQGLVLP